jgi:hypothetical protein
MRPKVDLRQLFSENIKVYLQLNNEFIKIGDPSVNLPFFINF